MGARDRLVIFLSHHSDDAELAKFLQYQIEKDFLDLFEIFVSGTSIVIGRKWEPQVTEKLNISVLHVVLCSDASVGRPWVNLELGAAIMLKKEVLPICHTDFIPRQLPNPFDAEQSIILSDPSGLPRLYKRLADLIGCRPPRDDFRELVVSVNDIERIFRNRNWSMALKSPAIPVAVRIPNPHVLCISSPQFHTDTFEREIEAIQLAFKGVRVEHRLSSQELRDLLASAQFDVLHISAYVCPITGDLIFSDIDCLTGVSVVPKQDRMAAIELVHLIEKYSVKLVVIAFCSSKALAEKLHAVTNVIAVHDELTLVMLIKWIEDFYLLLAKNQTLSEAFEDAVKDSKVPLKLYLKHEMTVQAAV